MKYRKLTDDDYTFGHGIGDYYTDIDAVAQAIKTRLKLLYGEWWEDLTIGMPLFQGIIGKRGTPANINAAEMIINDTIRNTQGVTAINNLKLEYDSVTRRMRYKAEIQTIYGTTQLAEVI